MDMEMNQNPTIQDAAQFALARTDHYLRVKLITGDTVLLDVKAAGGMLNGLEVRVEHYDGWSSIMETLRSDCYQDHFHGWDAIVWAKVLKFDHKYGEFTTVMEVK